MNIKLRDRLAIGYAVQPTFAACLIRVDATTVATWCGNVRLRRELQARIHRKCRLHGQQQKQHEVAYEVQMASGEKHMASEVNGFFASIR